MKNKVNRMKIGKYFKKVDRKIKMLGKRKWKVLIKKSMGFFGYFDINYINLF